MVSCIIFLSLIDQCFSCKWYPIVLVDIVTSYAALNLKHWRTHCIESTCLKDRPMLSIHKIHHILKYNLEKILSNFTVIISAYTIYHCGALPSTHYRIAVLECEQANLESDQLRYNVLHISAFRGYLRTSKWRFHTLLLWKKLCLTIKYNIHISGKHTLWHFLKAYE